MTQIILIEYDCAGERRHITHVCGAGDTPAECVGEAADELADAKANCSEGVAGGLGGSTADEMSQWLTNNGNDRVRIESNAEAGDTRATLLARHQGLVSAAQVEWPISVGGPGGA